MDYDVNESGDDQAGKNFQPQPEAGSGPKEPIFNTPTDLPTPPVYARKRHTGLRIFFGIIFALSIIANLFMFMGLMIVSAIAFNGDDFEYTQQVVNKGTKQNKIAIIRIEGVIDMAMSERVLMQIEKAQTDANVRGIIIRTISPGGSVVASDQIHHAIMQYREKTHNPVVAFMQGLAASGGYYTSVACDKIIAEPTTITGSIGVIMQTFTLQELMEEKLGIDPVTVKSGPKKDWPTAFSQVTPEQREYLMNKLIQPAYERFTTLIDQGRPNLDIAKVKELGDGSIYCADEALQNGLIDQIGYTEDAIELISALANVRDPYVFEYRQVFRFSDILGAEEKAKGIFSLTKSSIRDALTPELLYLWDGSN